jgi:alkaline phosphatase D
MSIFQHGIASGDPLQDRVLLWTRITTSKKGDVDVTWEISTDPDFKGVLGSGELLATADKDHTVSVDADGLLPGTHYYYRFHALGETSPTGRTKILPGPEVTHIRFAQASCAKFNAGFFNAYARMAEHTDLDFLLHLGDYIYEASNTPPAGQTPGADIGRPFEPLHECKTLADYRQRYSQYHRDPDVQKMHAALPVIATVDDHEFADGAWREGADVHVEERDGPWLERVKNALRARNEWLPIRLPDASDHLRVYRKVPIAGLADLFLINTRTHRDQPIPPPGMNEPSRSGLGLAQREWLFGEFERSTATWRLLGNPSVLATTWRADIPEQIKLALLKTKLIAPDGLGPDHDQWDGYPAERSLIFQMFRDHKLGNIVVLSGDIHACMVIDLQENPFDAVDDRVAVEFINTSLTSQNLDDKMKWGYRTKSLEYERGINAALPHIKWCDLDSHGYNIVDVKPDRVQVEYWLVDTVLERTNTEHLDSIWEVRSGEPRAKRVQ